MTPENEPAKPPPSFCPSLEAVARIDTLQGLSARSDRAEGYADQAPQLARQSGRCSVAGWKITATSAAGRSISNVEGPLGGRILKPGLCRRGGGGRSARPRNLMRVAQAEFAFVVIGQDDAGPAAAPYARRTR